MATRIGVGHIQAHEKLTARLYFTPTGDAGAYDLGNVVDYKEAHEREYKKRHTSEKGYRRHSDTEVDTILSGWDIVLDESDVLNNNLKALGTTGSATSASAVTAPSGTASFTSVELGRWYFLGKTTVNTVVVSVSASTKTLNTDYELDADLGAIKILSTGSIAADATVDVTFGCAADYHENITADDTVRFYGAVRLVEYNQHEATPLRTTTCNACIYVTNYPEQGGEFAKWTLRVVATSKPVITKRYSTLA